MRSQKIQNLLLSVPEIAANLKTFFNFPKESQISFLAPITADLADLSLSQEEVIEVIDTYSKNLSADNIDNECENIIRWLLDKQDRDGGWPLAWELGSENRKNAWANSICSLSLLKFRYYKNLSDKKYDGRISDAIRWLFDENNSVYIPGEGWKMQPADKDINLYDTSIALRAIFKYRSVCKKNNFTYSFSDGQLIEIINYLLNCSGEFPYWTDQAGRADIGATSYCVLTLIHFLNIPEIEDALPDGFKDDIENRLLSGVEWISANYENDTGWKNNENQPSFEVSCYAIQALLKCKNNFLRRLGDDVRTQQLWRRILAITVSEVARLQSCFTVSNDLWGWPAKFRNSNYDIRNTALATSSLLKCCYKTDIKIDFSIILRAVTCLIKSFNLERITLENTYILCSMVDYLIFRKNRKYIF